MLAMRIHLILFFFFWTAYDVLGTIPGVRDKGQGKKKDTSVTESSAIQ